MRALMYHGIVDGDDCDDYYATNFTRVGDFEEQARLLARHWTVLSLAEVHDRLRSGRPLPRRAVHISFDDGYRNNLVAAEILDRHRLPWTLFPVTNAVLDGYEPGYVRLADAISATNASVHWNGAKFELTSTAGKWQFARQVKSAIMDVPAHAYTAQVDAVLAIPGMQRPDHSRWPFLSGLELRELSSAGVEIGNHSARHLNLTRCDPAWLEDEIAGSRARLEDALATPVRFFAYPDGRYDDAVLEAVSKTHDVAMAVTTPDTPLAPMRIRREAVGAGVDALAAALGDPRRFRSPWRRARAALGISACAS
jgi:peptidoglycan/xylan/chitin deacetylase (PgdA/CDA1 family)